jgi:hypothetical protein
MTSIKSLHQSSKCGACGEWLVAPERSTHVSEEQVSNFWVCPKCGNEFETSKSRKRTFYRLVTRPRCSCVGAFFIFARVSGNFAMFAAIRRASSFVSSLAADSQCI